MVFALLLRPAASGFVRIESQAEADMASNLQLRWRRPSIARGRRHLDQSSAVQRTAGAPRGLEGGWSVVSFEHPGVMRRELSYSVQSASLGLTPRRRRPEASPHEYRICSCCSESVSAASCRGTKRLARTPNSYDKKRNWREKGDTD